MSCSCNHKDNLFENKREQRIEALTKAKREEQERQKLIKNLEQTRAALAIRDAQQLAEFKALQEAEKQFKIRERDILEKQLEETLAMQKRMQDQYQEFVTTTDVLAKKLNNPANLFRSSTITCVDEMKDYFKLTYQDGRVVKLPIGAVDFILEAKLNAIKEEFENHQKQIANVQAAVQITNDNVTKLSETFRELAVNVATHETDQTAQFEDFKAEIHTRVHEFDNGLVDTNNNLKEVVTGLKHLEAIVESLVANS